ncbi:unnamed protein product, partial [Choristocarpus tenellus]
LALDVPALAGSASRCSPSVPHCVVQTFLTPLRIRRQQDRISRGIRYKLICAIKTTWIVLVSIASPGDFDHVHRMCTLYQWCIPCLGHVSPLLSFESSLK